VFLLPRSPRTGPAEKAGLTTGDLVLAVDGKPVVGLADFYRKIWAVGTAGVEIRLKYSEGLRFKKSRLNR